MKSILNLHKMAAVLAAITIAGILPGAALAQNGRNDRRDWQTAREREQARERRNRNDRNDRGNRNGWDNRNDRNDWRDRDREADKRQKTKNDWRNLATAAGGVAALGILRRDPTIIFAGAAGGLYSLNRYEQDRKSQSSSARAKASLFSQPYLYRDGQRYERRTVTQNGQRYYRFVKP